MIMPGTKNVERCRHRLPLEDPKDPVYSHQQAVHPLGEDPRAVLVRRVGGERQALAVEIESQHYRHRHGSDTPYPLLLRDRFLTGLAARCRTPL